MLHVAFLRIGSWRMIGAVNGDCKLLERDFEVAKPSGRNRGCSGKVRPRIAGCHIGYLD